MAIANLSLNIYNKISSAGWCSGSTDDSGSSSPGSIPGPAATLKPLNSPVMLGSFFDLKCA